MSKKIDTIIEKFRPSEPVFELSLYNNDDSINCTLRDDVVRNGSHGYTGDTNNIDALTALVIESFQQQFVKHGDGKTGEYVVAKKQMKKNIIKVIKEDMLKHLENIMPQKNPRETKVFKWYKQAFDDGFIREELMQAIVDVYNYKQTQYNKGFASREEENKFDSNVLGILNLLYHRNS